MLLGGHPPADKAGSMRITQHKSEKSLAGSSPPPQTNVEVALSASTVQNQSRQPINGVIPKGDADFPPEAVKAFHENRPQPTHEFRNLPQNKPMTIQQPRKQ